MGISGEYILKSLEKVKENREKQILIASDKKDKIYREYPELSEFDKKIAEIFQNSMKELVAGKDVDFDSVEKESLSVQEAKKAFIKSNNIDLSAVEPVFDCEKCSDTGYYNGKICDCVKQKAISLSYDKLNKDVSLENYTFDKFNLDYYPKTDKSGVNPNQIMTKIRSYCVKYAKEFTPNSDSLLFFGKTGLGKTHLSLAIANDVIKKGYNVVYGPISRIIGNIEQEHFSNNNDNDSMNSVLNCDLLILDDLGTEFLTSFVASSLFDIINSRILNGKPTVINTNLDIEELKQKYSDRIVSRICGSYRIMQFFGEDIRNID